MTLHVPIGRLTLVLQSKRKKFLESEWVQLEK